MHITVVGAGTLGRIYGQRLTSGGDEVAFLVRSSRAAETSPFIIEQVNGGRRDVLEKPDRVTAVPPRTQAVIVAVRFDQLNGSSALTEALRGVRGAPIVVLTPILPRQQRAVEQAIGR